MSKCIVLATDNRYVDHCAVTMLSAITTTEHLDVYIFTDNLSSSSINKLEKVVDGTHSRLHVVNIKPDSLKDFPMPKRASDHISIATYYRLFVEKLLPRDIDRVLYLDCDMVVCEDLTELFEKDMDPYAIGAVYQNNEWALKNDSFGRLSIPVDKGYFNAGTLLINLEYWRKRNVTQRLFEYIEKNRDNIISHDQDVLNGTLYDETLPLDLKWNLLPLFFSKNFPQLSFPMFVDYKRTAEYAISSPSIVHYVYKPKPWEYGCDNPYKNLYFEYLKKLPWPTKTPAFNWESWWKYIFMPKYRNFRSKVKRLLYKPFL